MGFRRAVARYTLSNSNANAVRDWCIYADFGQSLINIARNLYTNEPHGLDLSDSLSTGHQNYRSVSVGVSLGFAPNRQGSDQVVSFARPSRQHSQLPTAYEERSVARDTGHHKPVVSILLTLGHYCLFISANFSAIVGFPLVSFFTDKSSALLLARRRLFSEPSRATLVF